MLVIGAQFLDRPGHLGQVLPVSRPTCSVGGSRINLVAVNQVLFYILPYWDSSVLLLGNLVSLLK